MIFYLPLRTADTARQTIYKPDKNNRFICQRNGIYGRGISMVFLLCYLNNNSPTTALEYLPQAAVSNKQ
jgi:hypothetical protein